MKLTKKLVALIVICMLVVAAFPLSALAADDERVSVYVKASANLHNCRYLCNNKAKAIVLALACCC